MNLRSWFCSFNKICCSSFACWCACHSSRALSSPGWSGVLASSAHHGNSMVSTHASISASPTLSCSGKAKQGLIVSTHPVTSVTIYLCSIVRWVPSLHNNTIAASSSDYHGLLRHLLISWYCSSIAESCSSMFLSFSVEGSFWLGKTSFISTVEAIAEGTAHANYVLTFVQLCQLTGKGSQLSLWYIIRLQLHFKSIIWWFDPLFVLWASIKDHKQCFN